MKLVQMLIFLLSASLVSSLLYLQLKVMFLQQILLVLMVVLIFVWRRFQTSQKGLNFWLLLFVMTFFIELLVAATGAIFSPFLVLIHLYVIGLALFFNFTTALVFLITEAIVLILNAKFDPNLLSLIKNDAGSVLIYSLSLLVITPISKLIAGQYHLKTDSLKTLFKKLTAEESVIEHIDDFVFMTDKNLQILSINDAAKKIVDPDKINTSLDQLINLSDEKGKHISQQTLLDRLSPVLNSVITQNSEMLPASNLNLMIEGYSLKLPNQDNSAKVIIRVNPIFAQTNLLERLVFLISQTSDKKQLDVLDMKLQEAHNRFTYLVDRLRKDSAVKVTALYLDVLSKYENTLLTASELALSLPAQEKMADIFNLFYQAIEKQKPFAQKLNVNLKLNVPESLEKEYSVQASQTNLPEHLTIPSSLSTVIDPKLIYTLLEKCLDIMTALAFISKSSVELTISQANNEIKLALAVKASSLPEEKMAELLQINQGHLEALDRLAISTGLESYIIKTIINLLHLGFTAQYNKYNSLLSFDITIKQQLGNH